MSLTAASQDHIPRTHAFHVKCKVMTDGEHSRCDEVVGCSELEADSSFRHKILCCLNDGCDNNLEKMLRRKL